MHGLLGMKRMNRKAALGFEPLSSAIRNSKQALKHQHAHSIEQSSFEEPAMDLHIVHSSSEKLRCLFSSVVIRNDSLNAKYKGGVRAFVETHRAITNRDISVFFSMGDEIDDAVRDLHANSLAGGEDFTFVDAGSYAIEMAFEKKEYPHNISVGVDWLKARYADDGVWVWYSKRGSDV